MPYSQNTQNLRGKREVCNYLNTITVLLLLVSYHLLSLPYTKHCNKLIYASPYPVRQMLSNITMNTTRAEIKKHLRNKFSWSPRAEIERVGDNGKKK